jgi:hypothetical protein
VAEQATMRSRKRFSNKDAFAVRKPTEKEAEEIAKETTKPIDDKPKPTP